METVATHGSETLVVKDNTAPSRSAPVITIVASSPLNTDNLDKDSIPCVIIEHVGTVPPSSSPGQTHHLSDSVHKCDECDYSSHNKHYLKQHIDLVHNPERPYKCPFCDYAGKRSHSLREHLVVHTNERPYECEHCNASFRKKGHLTNHIKLHTTQKLIKCSLCSVYLADQDAFEKHLKDTHNTDRIYACELCDFVAGDQSLIVKHIQSHDKVFKCSECSFVTADINKLASHADTHIIKPFHSEKSTSPLPSTTPPLRAQARPPLPLGTAPKAEQGKHVMIKCTECGFTAQDADTMKKHMWSHIKTEAEVETKPDVAKLVEKTAKIVPSAPKEIRVIEATLPDNAAYKCTECSFVHKEATVFIKHMLTHRVKPSVKVEQERPQQQQQQQLQQQQQPPQQQSQQQPQPHAGLKVEQTFLVAPVTKENTCKNSENTPFTHDPSTGRFKCIICGYTCEYQRTIKAHIWKHSGNQAIDYPMFQNGPLSMYDDIPTPKVPPQSSSGGADDAETPEDGKVSTPLGDFTVQKTDTESQQNPTQITAPVTHVFRSVSDNTITNIKLVKTDIAPKTVAGGTAICQMQTIDGKTLALVRDTSQKTSRINIPSSSKVAQLKESAPIAHVGKEETVITSSELKPAETSNSPERKLVISEVTSSSTGLNNTSPCEASSKLSKPPILAKNESPSTGEGLPSKLGEETPSEPPSGDAKLGPEQPIKRDDTNILQVAKRICFDKEVEESKTEEVSVVVESVDSVPSASGFTGMKSQQNSPRVPEQSQHDDWTEPGGSPETLPVDQNNSPSMTTRARTRHAAKVEKDKAKERLEAIQAKKLSQLEKMTLKEESATKGPLTRAKKHSEEAVTLLSLLKKGPNRNPVCALQAGEEENIVKPCIDSSEADSDTESEDEIVSEDLSSESAKPKTGICSSLLAVIEQLRERSKSESETDETAKNLPGRRQSRRRSRRESNEDELNVDPIENMEKIEEDGETKFRCKLCHYSNSRTLLIRLHMRLHKSKKPFECSLCDFIAGSSESLQDHMIRHCKMRTYPCKLCPSTFNYKSQLRAHMRAHSDKDPLICHMCDFETNDPMAYRNHLRFHADQYYHKCDLCNKLFVTKLELRSHKQELCYKDQPESIEDSDATDSDYEVPKDFFPKKENLKCSQCEFTTTSVAVFTDHARIHEETKTLKCEMCDFTAVSSRSLKSHMKRHINDQRYVQQPLEQYKCNLCGYVCHHLPSLKSHMWRHASDRNYSYEFTNDVINAAIDYDCRIDSSNTSDPDMLEKILISEKKILEGRLNNSMGPDGRQPVCWVVFKCCQCGFETINKAQLNVHMRSHSDIIQRTLEVSQGLVRHAPGGKRSAGDTLLKGDNPPLKIVKTQDHG
ncbi:zinc finger protein 507-like [Haliotis cracherodii]|uniref:zinc finger protein 507-like n=1 Tax=Haliotis cracherodii TaxID=6455 RepID=UPI0039E93A03